MQTEALARQRTQDGCEALGCLKLITPDFPSFPSHTIIRISSLVVTPNLPDLIIILSLPDQIQSNLDSRGADPVKKDMDVHMYIQYIYQITFIKKP